MSSLPTEVLSEPAISLGLLIGAFSWLLYVKQSNKAHQSAIDTVGHQLASDIEHLCRELASPSDHRRYVKTDLPAQGDHMNFLRKHIESYLKARVTKYIDDAFYSKQSTTRLKIKIKVGIVNMSHVGQVIQISFKLGRGLFMDHVTYFKPSTFAHATVFFKNEILSK